MPDIFLALLVGILFGMLCQIFNLPIPAPQAFAGIMGILGIYIGYGLLS